jgi:hypothetical protein
LVNITRVSRKNSTINYVKYFKNDNLLYEWKDTLTNPDIPKTFIREIGKSVYHYENGEMILHKSTKKTKPISKLQEDSKLNTQDKLITMDLETRIITLSDGKNVHEPYLLSWFNGITTYSYYITNYSDFKSLLINVFNDLLEYKNSISCTRLSVYFHNFSKFDSFFLLKYIAELGDVDPIIHKDRLIVANFTYIKCIDLPKQEDIKKENILKISFKDSLLILPISLRKLCISFKVSTNKGIFPYLFKDINYIGKVPEYQYFTKLSLEEYNKYIESYKGKIWNFRKEAIKYCELDCKGLYQVLNKFNHLINKTFNITIDKCPTLTSLSFRIWRAKYLPLLIEKVKGNTELLPHMLFGDVEKHIRKSYSGGAVDMYIPQNQEGELIYGYDVNALYPSVMKYNDMPIGTPTYFRGNILETATQEKDPFGFFFCDITAPDDLKHPILQIHYKTKSGIRTVAPLGKWSGTYFSEELYNAAKFGYKFEVKWGYTFERGNLFDKYVTDLYKLRLEYPKSDPMNYIAKLLLNSLYGRFGMDDNFMINEVLSKEEAKEIIELPSTKD